ncbi:hypothetical protein Catovirus_2_28 [Catovirus CTV1]|uniref:Uncharacterized protein n=1 Tax=Catovirus CTV1 TaxID=1977631 RepID=A0A1V0SBJ9_9VIRU|nr:hypothetical protein Catovirus_2_28 [Catovirus CTV1]
MSKKNYEYIRPNITYTDTLTKNEIISFLQDFEKVNDINNIPIGTYLSYIDVSNNKSSFRIGGTLVLNKEEYIVLAAGKTSFSVQKNNKIFFRRLSYVELKKEMEEKMEECRKIVNEKDEQIKRLIHYIKTLKSDKITCDS